MLKQIYFSKPISLLFLIGMLLLLVARPSTYSDPTFAQSDPVPPPKPIDMMLVIDNSCSMFPVEYGPCRNLSLGNDSEALRLVGANLFLARLGFAEINEDEYQLGVISLGEGDPPSPLIHLQPLSTQRDASAGPLVALKQTPEFETRIVPALQAAYRELRDPALRRATNQPAVVLITDGTPTPPEGQSEEDIQRLVQANPDIPLFIMLIQNSTDVPQAYLDYIEFWKRMQRENKHVLVYDIKDSAQIESTYNAIMAQLQSTSATAGERVEPGRPLSVFVSRYVQRIIVTVIHNQDLPKGTVTVKDPDGNPAQPGSPGVAAFRGATNPVEVISISEPRLRDDLMNKIWTVESDQPVSVFLDRQGAYRIHMLEPELSLTGVVNRYDAIETHLPDQDLEIRFELLDEAGQPITESQPIQGTVTYPDGTEANLRIPATIAPDANGTYTISFNPASVYPPVQNTPGRFTFNINAGSADERATERIPIATTQLLVQVGNVPFISGIDPPMLVCAAGQPAPLSVEIGNARLAQPEGLAVRVLNSDSTTVTLARSSERFTGDVASLCEPVRATLACGTNGNQTLRVRLTAVLIDGTSFQGSERDLEVNVLAPACEPTSTPPPPTPTPSPTPTPPPPPPPPCPERAGVPPLNGCAPSILLWLLYVAVSTGLVIGVFQLIRYLRVLIAPPPRAYVMICDSEDAGMPRSYNIYQIGMDRRASKVTIGGDRKRSHIYVKGLQAVEYTVERQGKRVIVSTTAGRPTILSDSYQSSVPTSSPTVSLRFCLVMDKLSC